MAKSGDTSEFWKRLTKARQRKNLSMDQGDIAKELELYQSAVTKWKTGKGLPILANAIKLALASDVCVEWLLTGRPPEHCGLGVDAELAKLVAIWDTLLPETAKEIVAYAVYRQSIQGTDPPAGASSAEIRLHKRKDARRGTHDHHKPGAD
jgi:transcriptional regulator with XRE-family HTH domain